MPREADPIPFNLANWNKNKFKLAHKERFLTYMLTIEAISDTVKKGELSEFAGSMLALKYLFESKDDPKFPERAWQDYLKRWKGGTVTIPASWVQTLIDAWELYVDPNHPISFEKAAGLSGDGKSRKASSKVNELTEKFYLAQFVYLEKLRALEKGELLSDDNAFNIVEEYFADFPEVKRSKSKIRDAWLRWGRLFEKHGALLSANLPDRVP